MSEDQAIEVFDQKHQLETRARPHDDDRQVDIKGSSGNWGGIRSLNFLKDLPPGQIQEIDTGDDAILALQQNQQIVVLGRQDTAVQGQITISSREDAIFVTAETQLVLTVGDSCIVMNKDGTIEILCKDLIARATNVNRIVGLESVQINHPDDMKS
ncbi:MAG TPA: hypothetical protein VJ302_16200 [Blastocatellia bacterium]|nr:hypothetical protein [Blastocatellia bacterium]